LEDVEHTPHEVYLPQYPEGLEAAISYPGPDLRWRNDSPYGVLVQAQADATSVTVTLWSTKRYKVELGDPVKTNLVSLPSRVVSGAGCVAVRGQDGFTVEITRELREDGELRGRQTFTAVYRPQAQVTCQGG
jgi:vancomycin resistance protein YoaR